MYGLINRSLQQMISENYGNTAYQSALTAAGVETETWISNEKYDDQLTYKIIGAICRTQGLQLEHFLFDFGKFWIHQTASKYYQDLLDASGKNFFDFLLNLPAFHDRVSLIYPKLKPPEFECFQEDASTLILIYKSERKGLVPFVKGLLDGLAEKYQVQIVVELVASDIENGVHKFKVKKI